MRYVLNSAVITALGYYEYRYMSLEEAKAWLMAAPFISTIGYPETAAAMTELFDVPIEVNRRSITMQIRDEALVFRLVFPPNAPRIDPARKGSVSIEYIKEHCEIGLLTREG